MPARKRWNYFKDRLMERFGARVYKVGVDAGFDCPNRDGSKGYGGCAYCSQEGSLSPHQDPKKGIQAQIENGMSFCRRRYKAEKFIVYFQAFTNTYDQVSVLKERYDSALIHEDILGLSIATRPDCITPENVALLKEYANKLPFFTVELGLQSAFQNRLDWVNRQEEVTDYIQAMRLLTAAEIPVITHVILGFPGESYQDMRATVDLAQSCGTHGLKLQMLHVIRGTKLAHIYKTQPFELMSMDAYGELILDLMQHIHPNIEIHRITGETDEASLVAPEWVRHKTKFFAWFDEQLEKRDIWQGKQILTHANQLQSPPNYSQSTIP